MRYNPAAVDTPLRETRPTQPNPFANTSDIDTPIRQGMDMSRDHSGLHADLNMSLRDTPMREVRQIHPANTSFQELPDPNTYTSDTNAIPDTSINAHPRGSWNSAGTPLRGYDHHADIPAASESLNNSIDTPMRGHDNHSHDPYSNFQNTNCREGLNNSIDTPLRGSSNVTQAPPRPGLNSVDTPLREAMNSNRIFYSPPVGHNSELPTNVAPPVSRPMSDSFTDTPMRDYPATSRHGSTSIGPPTTSRHGSVATNLPTSSNRLVRAPYEHEPESSQAAKPSYKLSTPYGNADNEIQPAQQTNISLSSAMDSIRNDMMRHQTAEQAPAGHGNKPFGATSEHIPFRAQSIPQHGYEQPPPMSHLHMNAEYHQTFPTHGYNQGQPASRRVSSASSDSAFTDFASNTSASHGSPHLLHTSATGPLTAGDISGLVRQTSMDNDDRGSVHSHGSGKLTY